MKVVTYKIITKEEAIKLATKDIDKDIGTMIESRLGCKNCLTDGSCNKKYCYLAKEIIKAIKKELKRIGG